MLDRDGDSPVCQVYFHIYPRMREVQVSSRMLGWPLGTLLMYLVVAMPLCSIFLVCKVRPMNYQQAMRRPELFTATLLGSPEGKLCGSGGLFYVISWQVVHLCAIFGRRIQRRIQGKIAAALVLFASPLADIQN